MEIDKNKKQKKLERVFVAPNLRPFLCLTIEEDTDVEDEFEIESEDGLQRKRVQQTIHGRVFTTEIVHEQTIDEENSMREEAKITYVLALGTRLIWEEGEGYIVTKEGFKTIDEIREDLNYIEGVK
jgi:hypothetical protein